MDTYNTRIVHNITFDNYFDSTAAIFKACKMPKREADYESDSGSRYWYGENKRGKYVIRLSNHWTRCNHKSRVCKKIASCQWQIVGLLKEYSIPFEYLGFVGKCYLSTFHKL